MPNLSLGPQKSVTKCTGKVEAMNKGNPRLTAGSVNRDPVLRGSSSDEKLAIFRAKNRRFPLTFANNWALAPVHT